MFRLTVVLLACLALNGPSQAGFVFTGNLSGAQETPPNTSPATGFATLTLDDNTISWNVMFSGFVGVPTVAHFHLGGLGEAGPVLYDIAETNPYTSPLIGSAALGVRAGLSVDQQKEALFAGRWYVNLHSTVFPGGEIRGQMIPTPVPPTALLGVVGVVAVAIRRRFVG